MQLLAALCDGAIIALGVFRTYEGPPRAIDISPANWAQFKYNGVNLLYDWIEVPTPALMTWLGTFPSIARDLEKRSPSEEKSEPTSAPLGPGRPTAMSLILPEAKRRVKAKQLPATKKQFAQDLSLWLRGTHPGAPPAGGKAIENDQAFTKLWRTIRSFGSPTRNPEN